MVNGYAVHTLQEALEVRNGKKVTPYAGGTDLMIQAKEDAVYLFLNKIEELKRITEDDECIRLGAACTFTQILEDKSVPEILRTAVSQIGAPAIRNMGTIGGNICNASPKADSALIFFVADAKLRLISKSGERILPIADFYLGRGKTTLQEDELLAEVLMPKKGVGNFYYQKVGARNALAISRVSFVGILSVEKDTIIHCATAFGAIESTIVRKPEIDQMLIGKTIAEAREDKEAYLRTYEAAIQPIQGRVSTEYRKQVCMNLLQDFLVQNGIS